MWTNTRLLRRVLLITSLLTLSGLHVHQDQPSAGWRTVRLLPPLIMLLPISGVLAHAFSCDSAAPLMLSLAFFIVILHSLLMLLYLLRHRRRLHALLHRAASLETATGRYREPGGRSSGVWCLGVVAGLDVTAVVGSVVVFFGSGRMQHPRYLLPLLVPATLQTQGSYWIIIGLQLACSIVQAAMQVASDLLLIGLTDTVGLLLAGLRHQLEQQLGVEGFAPTSSSPSSDSHGEGNGENADLDTITSAPRAAGKVRIAFTSDRMERFDAAYPPTQAGISIHSRPSTRSLTSAPYLRSELESQLRQLSSTLRTVRRLASDVSDFFSFPVLSLYAGATGCLLLGGYITLVAFHSRDGSVLGLLVSGAYLLLMMLRVVIVSYAGSRLVQQGQRLHEALAEVSWPADGSSSAARFSLQLMLEQTRRPAAIRGCDLFTAQNSTMLSLLGFVLTYFVIMVQMEV